MEQTNKRYIFDDNIDEDFDSLGEDLFDDEDETEDDEDSIVLPTKAPESFSFVDQSLLKTPETIINSKKLYAVQTFKEYEAYVLDNVLHNDVYRQTRTIAYDIETNAESPIASNAKIIGFSNAFSNNNGVYIVRDSLEYTMPDSDWDKIVELFKKLMDSSIKVVVHNRKYENPYTINCMDYNITNDHIEDTMIKCRVLFPGEPAGLKSASARLLNYSDWDTELSTFTKAAKQIIELVTYFTTAKRISQKHETDYKLYQYLFEQSHDDVDPIALSRDLVSGVYGFGELVLNFQYIFQILGLNNIIEKQLFVALLDRIQEIANDGGLKVSVIPYSMIPMKIIAKYGALDAIATYELNEYCDAQFQPKSEELRNLLHQISDSDTFDHFDFHKGYDIVKAQFDAGIKLEMSGAHWNDTIADGEYDWHNDTAVNAWFRLFENTKFTKIIKDQNRHVLLTAFLSEVLTNLKDNIQTEYTDRVKNFLDTKGSYIIQKTQIKFLDQVVETEAGQGTYLTVRFSKLYETYKDEIDALFSDVFEQKFAALVNRDKIKNYLDVKEYYNPTKSVDSHYALIDSVLNSSEFKYATFYALCLEELKSDIHYWEISDGHPNLKFYKGSIALFQFLEKVTAYNNEQRQNKGTPLNQRAVFEQFMQFVGNVDFSNDFKIKELLDKAYNFKITSMKEKLLLEIYNRFLLMGINVDDESTWNEEFIWLYAFRTYKKAVKIITTYVTGKVGRKSVMVVDKNTESDLLPRRLRYYYDNEVPYNKDTESLLMSLEFGVCTADTGRWRSGLHTLPADSTVKNIYRSRYQGGIICSPDYSQMEVRAIAVAAKEDAMLEVFANDEDIHAKTASIVYHKPIEDVTSNERKYSKAATFAVLYGSSEQGLAQETMNGDLEAAKHLMSSFYVGYPKLKVWVDAMHDMYKKQGYVALASNRLIRMNKPQKSDPKYMFKYSKGLRQSQNYPIQGLSNDVAGMALFLILDYINTHNLKSKAFSFVHDALYFDIHPDEIFEVTGIIEKVMNEYPREVYNLPAKADLVFGVSMGQELAISDFERTSLTEGSMILSGYEEDFNELIDGWKQVYQHVEWEDIEEPKTKYVSRSDLFAPKKTISRFFGQTRTVVTRKAFVKIR